MRLLLLVHNVVMCYFMLFMLAPITVDGRPSPPSDTTTNLIHLHQPVAIVISLSLLLAPVAVDAGYEECKPPKGIIHKRSAFELTPTKEGINALFSVGYQEPLVVRTAAEYTPGAVRVRVSSDEDCYSTVVAGADENSKFTVERWCPPSEAPTFGPKTFYAKQLLVTVEDKLVVYADGNTKEKDEDWDKFEPYDEDEKEGWTLWNLTFIMPPRSSQPLTLFMDDKVKIKCSVPDTSTASTTTGNSTANGNVTLSPGSSGDGKAGTADAGGTGETRIAGLLAWKFVVIVASIIILLLLLVNVGIVIAFVCYRRKMRQRIVVLTARAEDKPEKSEKEAKDAERKKELADLERSEKRKNRDTEKAAWPPSGAAYKTVLQMRNEWFEKNNKTQSFREQFNQWEQDHMRRYPRKYQNSCLWDHMQLPEEREELYHTNCEAVELWGKGGQPDDTLENCCELPEGGWIVEKERTASAKSAEPVKSTKSAKKANGTTKNASEKPKERH